MDDELQTSTDILGETPKKQQIIAAYKVAGERSSKQEIAEALDASYEYIRQIFKDIESRDPDEWEKLREGDLDDEPGSDVQDAVAEKLRKASIELSDAEVDDLREAGTSEKVAPPEGSVSVENLAHVRERVELLHQQAQFTENRDAQFVAEKSLEWLEELIERAE